MGNCASASTAKDCEDSVELRVKKLLQPGHRRGKRKSRTSIQLSGFADHARRLLETKEGEEELDRQLERLNLIGSNCERLIFSVECGQSLRNALKNRYTNVLPYDSNRITLSVPINGRDSVDDNAAGAEADGDEEAEENEETADLVLTDPLMRLTLAPSDYVNASPVRLGERQFIASQGPLPETLAHHWQMIWERGVRQVAMVTDCEEQGRSACARYWPERVGVGAGARFGPYTVTMESEETLDDGRLVRRTLLVTGPPNTGGDGETRRLQHLQYLGLPMSVDWTTVSGRQESLDSLAASFCAFAAEVGAGAATDWPTLVHCDSGVGRAGVLLCLLSFSAESLRSSQQVDVPAAVIGLRLSRPGMVHSRNQLAFVYKCLLHYLRSEKLIADGAEAGDTPDGSPKQAAIVQREQ